MDFYIIKKLNIKFIKLDQNNEFRRSYERLPNLQV
jgi:hypothetical protein